MPSFEDLEKQRRANRTRVHDRADRNRLIALVEFAGWDPMGIRLDRMRQWHYQGVSGENLYPLGRWVLSARPGSPAWLAAEESGLLTVDLDTADHAEATFQWLCPTELYRLRAVLGARKLKG